jgi:apolipoprotein N-acyltransferase
MNLRWPTRLLLALGSGIALAASFPNYNLYWLGWASVCLLVLASLGARLGLAALCGFLHGLIFYPVALPWIDTVMRQYGGIGAIPAAAVLGLISAAGGCFSLLFSVAIAQLSRSSIGRACLLAPFLWVTLEFARTHLPYLGFPWNLLGYVAANSLALVQVTSWTGIFGLSLLVAGYNGLLAYSIATRNRRAGVALLAATAGIAVVVLVGFHFVPSEAPRQTAHLVQTNFPQSEFYPGDWLQVHAGELDELEKISVEAARRSPGLVVWPEVPAPLSFQDSQFAARAERIARESQNYFLVGAVDWKQGANGEWQASNSAVLLDPAGRRVFTYDKIHLVPFGEYVPLRRWIKFAGKLTANIGDFTPGSAYRLGSLPLGRFAVFICYEAIFPGEIRRFETEGAELLINTSNDGWFGHSAAPAQHLMMARVRAVENRRWLLRDTNNGLTVSVDPYGRYAARLAPDIRGELDAPYNFRKGITLYARWGDWAAWACVVLSALLLGSALVRPKATLLAES